VPKVSDKGLDIFFEKKSSVHLLSVQKSSKDEYDILYSYLLSKDRYDSILNSRSWIRNRKISSRLFNGVDIHEVKNASNEVELAFTYLNGIFVLSQSALLTENAIRVYQNQDQRGFKIINPELFQFPSLKSDHGNLYSNINNLSEISFKGFSLLRTIPVLHELKNVAVYDVKSNGKSLSFNGFSLGKNSSLGLFQKQRPTPLNVVKYIPNYSDAFVHFGISDFHSITELNDTSFLKNFNTGNEIAFISAENRNSSLAAFIEINPNSSRDFNFITDYVEAYSTYQIRGVDGRVLKKGFEKIFPDVVFNFCTVKDNYLFLSQSVEEIKLIIDAIENDDTWGKTLDYQKFSERGLQESNVTLIFKKPELFKGYRSLLQSYPSLIDSTGLAHLNWYSIQMSALDKNFYSNVNFSFGSSELKSTERRRSAKSSFIEFPGNVRFAGLVKNHITGLQDIIIQDADLIVYLISLKDGISWKRQFDGPIQEPLQQLDFYKNGKLQYFFVTKERINVIDRLGRDVTGFPKSVLSQIKFAAIVDYDKSKNYRFIISSVNNEVYLFDKEGKNLSEWGPKKFESAIVQSPQHIKIGGKDYFIIMLADGTVKLINRKGEFVNTFKTKELISGDYFLESGMSPSSTFISYTSKEGTMVKQNLNGEILKTDNLMRGRNSRFILKRCINSDKFFFYRVDAEKIAIFDGNGTLLIEKQNSGSMNLEFQCIETASRQIIFSFFDVEQRLVQVLDVIGNSLIQIPIESDVMPLFGLGKSKNEFGIYSFPGNSVVFNLIR